MIGIILTLFAAATYALSTVLAKKGLNESDIISGTAILTLVGICCFLPLTLLFTNLRTVTLEALFYFALAGALAPGLFTLLFLKYIKVFGASATPSLLAVVPLFGSAFGVLILQEIFSVENWIGAIFVAVGVAAIGRSMTNPKKRSSSLKKALFYPLLAGLILALSIVTRKHALSIYNEPLIGATIGLCVSLFMYIPLFFSVYKTGGLVSFSKKLPLFWKAGIWGAVAELAAFSALSYERAATVIPILQTEILFTLFFAHLYLKETELISSKLVASTILVATGAILVSIR